MPVILKPPVTSLLVCLLLLSGCYYRPERPADLEEQGVVVGEGFLRKERFVYLPLGENGGTPSIYEFARAKLPDDTTDYLAVATSDDVYFFSPSDRSLQGVLDFPPCFSRITDVDHDGQLERFCQESGAFWFYGEQGELIWEKIGDFDTNDYAWDGDFGDIDDDGMDEFCLATTDALVCYNASGEEMWREGQGDSFLQVAILPHTTESGARIISLVELDGFLPMYLEQRAGDGQLVSRMQYYSDDHLRIIRWPPETDSFAMLTHVDSQLLVIDFEGRTLLQFTLPGNYFGFTTLRGTTITLSRPNGPQGFLAAIVGYAGRWNRSSLLLFDSSGQLVFHEIQANGGNLFATHLEDGKTDGESLIVGLTYSPVFQYVPVDEAAESSP